MDENEETPYCVQYKVEPLKIVDETLSSETKKEV